MDGANPAGRSMGRHQPTYSQTQFEAAKQTLDFYSEEPQKAAALKVLGGYGNQNLSSNLRKEMKEALMKYFQLEIFEEAVKGQDCQTLLGKLRYSWGEDCDDPSPDLTIQKMENLKVNALRHFTTGSDAERDAKGVFTNLYRNILVQGLSKEIQARYYAKRGEYATKGIDNLKRAMSDWCASEMSQIYG